MWCYPQVHCLTRAPSLGKDHWSCSPRSPVAWSSLSRFEALRVLRLPCKHSHWCHQFSGLVQAAVLVRLCGCGHSNIWRRHKSHSKLPAPREQGLSFLFFHSDLWTLVAETDTYDIKKQIVSVLPSNMSVCMWDTYLLGSTYKIKYVILCLWVWLNF